MHIHITIYTYKRGCIALLDDDASNDDGGGSGGGGGGGGVVDNVGGIGAGDSSSSLCEHSFKFKGSLD